MGVADRRRRWAWRCRRCSAQASACCWVGARCQAWSSGMIISVASTMVLSRLLIDRGQLQSQHGKVMIGITLVEDLVVVVLTILMPVLASLTPHHLLGVAQALGKAALILVPIGFLAVYLVPRALDANRALAITTSCFCW